MQEMQETWVLSLGQEDPLEEEMATHSSILAWIIQWIEEPGRLLPCGHKESDTKDTHAHTMDQNIYQFSIILKDYYHNSILMDCQLICLFELKQSCLELEFKNKH